MTGTNTIMNKIYYVFKAYDSRKYRFNFCNCTQIISMQKLYFSTDEFRNNSALTVLVILFDVPNLTTKHCILMVFSIPIKRYIKERKVTIYMIFFH